MKTKILLFSACLLLVFFSCSKPAAKDVVLKDYPLDNLDGLIHQSGVTLDSEVTSDGNGSLMITVTEPMAVRLFETGDLDIEDAALIYQAKVRTEDFQGRVYLEMWCSFEGKGEFFSRGLQAPLSGRNDWTSEETPFFLKKGDNPANVKLNIVCEGTGTVWVDDIRLVKRK